MQNVHCEEFQTNLFCQILVSQTKPHTVLAIAYAIT